MSVGTLFQLIGAIVGIIWALLAHQYVLASLFALHLVGDGIVGFLKPLQALVDFESGKAKQYVKLRPFLLFVGIMLMGVGHLGHVGFKLLWAVPVTSFGLFYLGLALALIGGFTYDLIYT